MMPYKDVPKEDAMRADCHMVLQPRTSVIPTITLTHGHIMPYVTMLTDDHRLAKDHVERAMCEHRGCWYLALDVMPQERHQVDVVESAEVS